MTAEWLDATIVMAIVMATVGIGYFREYGAEAAAHLLRARLSVRTGALRVGHSQAVPPEALVPGDVVLLSAGSLVPADGGTIDANDFFVCEAVLTPLFRSRPGTLLLTSTVGCLAFALCLPYVPFAGALGFVPLPVTLLGTIVMTTVAYVIATELRKRWFYRSRPDACRHETMKNSPIAGTIPHPLYRIAGTAAKTARLRGIALAFSRVTW